MFVLASLAGHRNISTTQRYITVNDDVKRSAVELVLGVSAKEHTDIRTERAERTRTAAAAVANMVFL